MFVYDVCKTFMACFSNATKITIDVPISFIQLSMFHCSVKLSQIASGLLIGLDVKFAHIRVIFPAPLIMQQKWRDIINRTGGCPLYHHGKNIHTPIYVYNIHQCRLHALSCKGNNGPPTPDQRLRPSTTVSNHRLDCRTRPLPTFLHPLFR